MTDATAGRLQRCMGRAPDLQALTGRGGGRDTEICATQDVIKTIIEIQTKSCGNWGGTGKFASRAGISAGTGTASVEWSMGQGDGEVATHVFENSRSRCDMK